MLKFTNIQEWLCYIGLVSCLCFYLCLRGAPLRNVVADFPKHLHGGGGELQAKQNEKAGNGDVEHYEQELQLQYLATVFNKKQVMDLEKKQIECYRTEIF